MSKEIISTLMSFIGIILSVIVSFFISRRTFSTESKKVYLEAKKVYESKLLDKRLDMYPELYALLSQFIKDIENRLVDKAKLNAFGTQFREWDTKNSLFFSQYTGSVAYAFRRNIEKLMTLNEEDLLKDLSSIDFIKELARSAQKLEIALKSDLGIYGIDFSSEELQVIVKEKYGSLPAKV